MIDTSVVRVHQHGSYIAGNKEEHIGRSRGGGCGGGMGRLLPLGVVVRWGNVLTHPYLGAVSGRAAYRAAMLAL
jgi:hypothetical protein